MSDLVAFDLDDTLVPEVLFLKSGVGFIARWLAARLSGISTMRVEGAMMAAVENRQNHYSALERLFEEFGIYAGVDMKKIVEEFRSHLPDPDVYHIPPSMVKILVGLKKKGVPLALITDGRSSTQRNKIRAAGLDLIFPEGNILISEETGHDKNDPDNFLFLMRKYAGIDRFHYVADNPAKDFRHPGALGWETHLVAPFPLAVHSSGGAVRECRGSGVSAGSMSIADLPSLVSRCGAC